MVSYSQSANGLLLFSCQENIQTAIPRRGQGHAGWMAMTSAWETLLAKSSRTRASNVGVDSDHLIPVQKFMFHVSQMSKKLAKICKVCACQVALGVQDPSVRPPNPGGKQSCLYFCPETSVIVLERLRHVQMQRNA